jgi:hypothetical protein
MHILTKCTVQEAKSPVKKISSSSVARRDLNPVLTLCCSYLNPYCLGRKTAFFQWAFKFTCKTRNRNPLQGKKIITIKLKKTE